MNAAVQQIILSPPPLSPQVQAWANAVSIKPSKNYLKNLNTFVLALQSANIWSQLDRMWVFASETRDNALVDLVSLSSITEEPNGGTLSWTALSGYTGDGSYSYINSNFNPSTNGVNYQQNSASYGIFCNSIISIDSQLEIGCGTTSHIAMYLNSRNSSGNESCDINDNGGASSFSVLTSFGLNAAFRTNSAASNFVKNGSTINTQTVASATLPNLPAFFLCQNLNGTATSFSSRQISMAFIGGGGINQSALYNAWNNFLTSL